MPNIGNYKAKCEVCRKTKEQVSVRHVFKVTSWSTELICMDCLELEKEKIRKEKEDKEVKNKKQKTKSKKGK